MPDHGTSSRIGKVDAGGARGWHQRAKLSITIMRPPQYGHGGRASSGRSDSGCSTTGASSSRRAWTRLSMRAEPASRP